MCIQNVAANHRGNDVIVREGAPQSLQARFMYGPFDVVALSGILYYIILLLSMLLSYP